MLCGTRRKVTLKPTAKAAGGDGAGDSAGGRINGADGRILLKFGAVDHEANVWVNGMFVGNHKGGYTPFSLDITQAGRCRGKYHCGAGPG